MLTRMGVENDQVVKARKAYEGALAQAQLQAFLDAHL